MLVYFVYKQRELNDSHLKKEVDGGKVGHFLYKITS